MMVLSRHWCSNFNNYFVDSAYLLCADLIISVTLVSLTQALAYLVRGYCFSKYYHSSLVLEFTNDLFNYYVVYFLGTITNNAMASL